MQISTSVRDFQIGQQVQGGASALRLFVIVGHAYPFLLGRLQVQVRQNWYLVENIGNKEELQKSK